MSDRQLARGLAIGRCAAGAAFAAAPGLLGARWIGPDAELPTTHVLGRALGARDLAIGLGTLIALERDAPVRGWLEAGVLADAADFAATCVAGRDLPPVGRAGVLVMAGAAAGMGTWLARSLS